MANASLATAEVKIYVLKARRDVEPGPIAEWTFGLGENRITADGPGVIGNHPMSSARFNTKYKIVKTICFNMVPGGVHNHTFVENYNRVYSGGTEVTDPENDAHLRGWTTCYMIVARGYPAAD